MSDVEARLPTVTVIVPVRDDPRLRDCLAALQRQHYPAGLIDIVVADNGSRTDIAAALEPSGPVPTRLVREPRGGSYTARNAALRVATGAVLAFTDADCRPDPGWLSAAVAALTPGTGIVAGRVSVYARDARRPHPVEAYELLHAFPQRTYVSRGGACVTANLVTTREVVDTAGPFLDDLMSGADIEWSQRVNHLGFRTRYVPEAVVAHPARSSYGQVRAKLVRVMSGRAERDRLEGRAAPPHRPPARAWIPPLGAFRRALRSRELPTARAKAALIVGEFHHRYVSAWIASRMAAENRRTARSDSVLALRDSVDE